MLKLTNGSAVEYRKIVGPLRMLLHKGAQYMISSDEMARENRDSNDPGEENLDSLSLPEKLNAIATVLHFTVCDEKLPDAWYVREVIEEAVNNFHLMIDMSAGDDDSVWLERLLLQAYIQIALETNPLDKVTPESALEWLDETIGLPEEKYSSFSELVEAFGDDLFEATTEVPDGYFEDDHAIFLYLLNSFGEAWYEHPSVFSAKADGQTYNGAVIPRLDRRSRHSIMRSAYPHGQEVYKAVEIVEAAVLKRYFKGKLGAKWDKDTNPLNRLREK